MVAMAMAITSLRYPIATMISHRVERTPNKLIRVQLGFSRVSRRKNYLRRKILKTLSEPHNPIEVVEPRIGFGTEPSSENDVGSGLVGENEVSSGGNGNGLDLGSYEVVESLRSEGLKGYGVFSSRVVVRVIASFVGLFVLQTVVSVWVMGMGGSDEDKKNVGVEHKKRDMNGNVYLGRWGGDNNVSGELEMEARIVEIRAMAREVRENERKSGLRSSEESVSDVFDDDSDDESDDLEVGSSKIQSGIVKEVDKRLTKLRQRSVTPMLNVNYLNKVGANKNKGRNRGRDRKEDNDMLMFKVKRKYRTRLKTDTSGKPKGFGTIEGDHSAKEKPMYMDDEQSLQNLGVNETDLGNNNEEINGVDNSYRTRVDVDSQIDGKKPELGSSSTLKASKKGFGSNGATKKSNKQRTTSKKSGNRRVTKDLDKGRGVVQDYSRAKPVRNGPTIGDDVWWFALPYVLVIVMQTGSGGEEQQGFYTIRIDSDAKNMSYTPYIVGFEDRGDAKNFGYLLELAFEDLPDAAIDVVPLSAKELKEAMEFLNKKVIVVKKGQLQLYAGQLLDEVESALRSLVK